MPNEELEGAAFSLDSNGRVPFKGSFDFSFKSFTSAISTSLLKSLQDDCRTAMSARKTREASAYSSGDTFFLPFCLPPRTGLEQLANEIFKHHTKNVQFDPSCSGAEWWTQCIDSEDDIGTHWDGDYGLEEYGWNVRPHVATVSYLSELGGPTIVLEKESGPKCGENFSSVSDKMHFSFPTMGKHMSFDGRFLHCAPSEFGTSDSGSEIGNGSSSSSSSSSNSTSTNKIKSKKRITFLVNVWVNHCPTTAEPLDDKFLATMKLATTDVKLDLSRAAAIPEIKLEIEEDSSFDLDFVTDDKHAKLKIPLPHGGINEILKQYRADIFNKSGSLSVVTEGGKVVLEMGVDVESGDEEEDSESGEGSEDEDLSEEKRNRKKPKLVA